MQKISKILIIALVASIAVVGKSYGQHFALTDYEEPNPDKWGRENESLINPTNYSFPTVDPDSSETKDSLVIKPELVPKHARLKNELSPKNESKPVQATHEDDSILSFNFLYYIIQKYKLQDIVD